MDFYNTVLLNRVASSTHKKMEIAVRKQDKFPLQRLVMWSNVWNKAQLAKQQMSQQYNQARNFVNSQRREEAKAATTHEEVRQLALICTRYEQEKRALQAAQDAICRAYLCTCHPREQKIVGASDDTKEVPVVLGMKRSHDQSTSSFLVELGKGRFIKRQRI